MGAPLGYAAARGSPPPPSLATLLLECLHFYGHCFDPQRHAIAPYLNGTGQWGSGFVARSRGGGGGDDDYAAAYAHDPLLIVDPVNANNNVGQSCYRIRQIQKLFRDAAAAVHAGADEAVARASDGVPPDMDALVGLLLAGSLTGAQQAEQESEQPDKGASA